MLIRFSYANLKERGHQGDIVVDGRIILKSTLKNYEEYADWIRLAQDSDQWRALVFKVIKFRCHKILAIS